MYPLLKLFIPYKSSSSKPISEIEFKVASFLFKNYFSIEGSYLYSSTLKVPQSNRLKTPTNPSVEPSKLLSPSLPRHLLSHLAYLNVWIRACLPSCNQNMVQLLLFSWGKIAFCFHILPGLESCMLLYTSHNLYHDTAVKAFLLLCQIHWSHDHYSHIIQ